MANIFGTAFADVLVGTSDGDSIWAYGGDDFLDGKQGDDFLYGGDGNDQLKGGSGDDNMYGGSGDDLMTGGSGNDLMYGGDGHDYLSGGGGNDYVIGGLGDDWVQGGGGDDRVLGGSGNDLLQGQDGNDALSGGQGSDILNGGTGADQFHWIAKDFQNPTGSTDVITDFHSFEGDSIHFSNGSATGGVFVTQAALNAALAAPGVNQVFSTAPGMDSVMVEFVNGPSSVSHTAGAEGKFKTITYNNDPTKLDTHIVFTDHGGHTSDIWVWDAVLTSSDFVVV